MLKEVYKEMDKTNDILKGFIKIIKEVIRIQMCRKHIKNVVRH